MAPEANELRCGCCGSTHLTPPLDIGASGYGVHVKIPPTSDGFLDSGSSAELKARVCGSCGWVMLALAPDSLASLRYNWQRIRWPGRS
ncbi:MAG: hypothetical protein R3B13_20045 [Polyangiaceae bacterium]